MNSDPGAARVLVVEDDALNRRLLVRGVEHLGHQVVAAADGAAALEVLGGRDVDLVLLDLVLPEIDGFGVLEAMHADPELVDIPVIVISAIDESEQMARSIALGAIDHLPKPFDPLLLRVRVETALRQRRLRRLEQDYLRQEVMLRQQDKLATLGRLSAGLAHEINNPVAAALRMVGQLTDRLSRSEAALLELVPAVAEHVDRSHRWPGGPAAPEAEDAIEELLGAAGVPEPWRWAGELARAGIGAAATREILAATPSVDIPPTFGWLVARASTTRLLEQVAGTLDRVSAIVGALRSYSYVDQAPQQAVDVHAGIDDTLVILEHKTASGVTIVRDYDREVPLLEARGGELNQVWTNVLDNALDAVGDRGRIVVRTSVQHVDSAPHVVVEFEDDGPGIEPDLLGRVFDPFVTTKEPGRGTGLGLNVTHRIVTAGHGGRVEIRSRPGCTLVQVSLPVHETEDR